jgi:hypothetical protein
MASPVESQLQLQVQIQPPRERPRAWSECSAEPRRPSAGACGHIAGVNVHAPAPFTAVVATAARADGSRRGRSTLSVLPGWCPGPLPLRCRRRSGGRAGRRPPALHAATGWYIPRAGSDPGTPTPPALSSAWLPLAVSMASGSWCVDGTQGRGGSVLEQRAVRGISACQWGGPALGEEHARPTGKGTNRALG